MKTLRIAVILFFTSVQLMAQVSFGLKVSGGGSLPFAPSGFKDNYKMGYNAGAGLTVSLLGLLNVEGEVEYHTFAVDTDKMTKTIGYSGLGISVSGGDISILSLMANLKLYLIPKVSPITIYLLGGGGLTTMKSDDVKMTILGVSQTVKGMNESKVGVQAGAGIQIGIGAMSFFVEGKYVTILTEDDKTAFTPIKAGLIFGF